MVLLYRESAAKLKFSPQKFGQPLKKRCSTCKNIEFDVASLIIFTELTPTYFLNPYLRIAWGFQVHPFELNRRGDTESSHLKY